MIPVRWTENDRHEFGGKSIMGMNFVAYVNHTTANTAFTANPVNAELIKVKLRFWKAKSNKWYTLFDDALAPLALASGFFDGNFQQVLQIGTYVANVYIAAAMSVDEVIAINYKILFSEPVNAIEPGDNLVFECQVPGGALGATGDASVSTFYYDIIETIGIGKSIPSIKCESLRASISSDKYSTPEGALYLRFINTDKAGITSAVQVITDTNFQSNKWNSSDDFFDLLNQRNGLFEDIAQSNVRNQSFDLFSMRRFNLSGMHPRVDGGSLDVTLTSGNVTAGKNWYVTESLVNDDNVFALWKRKFPGQWEQNLNAPAQR